MEVRKLLIVAALAMPVSIAQASEPSSTKTVVDHHLASFGAGDVNAIMADYTEESIMILPNAVLHGKAAIRKAFEAFVAEFSKPGVDFKLIGSNAAGDVASVAWKADTPDNVYRFASDTFVIDDGKIRYQTVALDVTPKK